MRKRHQYRMLQTAFVFALIGVAFFGAYSGIGTVEQTGHQPAQAASHGEGYPSAFWHWLTHDAAGFFTLALCFITGWLAYVTRGLYVATAQLADDSRDASAKALAASTEATNLARDEFTATHRPKIILRRAYAPISDPLETNINITYTLVNVGETRAIVERVSLRLDFKPQSGYPIHGLPIEQDASNMLPNGTPIVIDAGASHELPYLDPTQGWDLPRRETYEEPKQGLFFIGIAEYTDESSRKTQRRTAWYRKYDIHSQSFGGFVWPGPNEYEYAD